MKKELEDYLEEFERRQGIEDRKPITVIRKPITVVRRPKTKRRTKKTSKRVIPSKLRISKVTSGKVGRGVQGLVGALFPQQIIAGATPYRQEKEGRVKSGRGRPKGTYKTRLVNGRLVKVPTHVYRKMVSEARTRRRLELARQQAIKQQQFEAEQMAMQQDPRFQGGDEFAEGPDMDHEQRVAEARQRARIQQMQQPQARPQGSFAGNILRRIGSQLTKPGMLIPAQRQQQYPQQPPQIQQYPQMRQEIPPSHINLFGKSSILNTPNIFNKPQDSNMI